MIRNVTCFDKSGMVWVKEVVFFQLKQQCEHCFWRMNDHKKRISSIIDYCVTNLCFVIRFVTCFDRLGWARATTWVKIICVRLELSEEHHIISLTDNRYQFNVILLWLFETNLLCYCVCGFCFVLFFVCLFSFSSDMVKWCSLFINLIRGGSRVVS